MKTHLSPLSRSRLLRDFIFIIVLGFGLKLFLDLFIWRYSGPVSLIIMLGLIRYYLGYRGLSFRWLGLSQLTSLKSRMLLVPQTLIAFILIPATGVMIGLSGEALGLEFMSPDASGAADRFGDLAGNTPLYLMWLAILWIAGPAEELYFRGFMIRHLHAVLGTSAWSSFLSILIPAIIFGVGHMYYQGLRGFFMTGAIGLSMGILFVVYKFNIWPLAVAHAAFNSLVFTALYMEWDI